MSDNATVQSQESVPPPGGGEHGPSIEFFAIGIALNLILIGAFFLWAYRQGKKRDKPDH